MPSAIWGLKALPARFLERLRAYRRDDAVVGIGIGGDELKWTARAIPRGLCRFAADHGMRLTAHAGENAGPESIWGAAQSARGADRTRAYGDAGDPELVEELAYAASPGRDLPHQ